MSQALLDRELSEVDYFVASAEAELEVLFTLYQDIQTRGVSRATFLALESASDNFDWQGPGIRTFTEQPSPINKEVVLEGIAETVVKVIQSTVRKIYEAMLKLLKWIRAQFDKSFVKEIDNADKQFTKVHAQADRQGFNYDAYNGIERTLIARMVEEQYSYLAGDDVVRTWVDETMSKLLELHTVNVEAYVHLGEFIQNQYKRIEDRDYFDYARRVRIVKPKMWDSVNFGLPTLYFQIEGFASRYFNIRRKSIPDGDPHSTIAYKTHVTAPTVVALQRRCEHLPLLKAKTVTPVSSPEEIDQYFNSPMADLRSASRLVQFVNVNVDSFIHELEKTANPVIAGLGPPRALDGNLITQYKEFIRSNAFHNLALTQLLSTAQTLIKDVVIARMELAGLYEDAMQQHKD